MRGPGYGGHCSDFVKHAALQGLLHHPHSVVPIVQRLLQHMWLILARARRQALLERLRNEMTRLAGVKAVAQVAASRLDLDLGPVLEPVLAQLTAFLRKANRPLRQAALTAIEARPAFSLSIQWSAVSLYGFQKLPAAGMHQSYVSRYARLGRHEAAAGTQTAQATFARPWYRPGSNLAVGLQAVVAARGARVSAEAVGGIVDAAAPLVSDGDLVVSALALHACVGLLARRAASARAVTAHVLPRAIALAQSPLLQARRTSSWKDYCPTLCRSGLDTSSSQQSSGVRRDRLRVHPVRERVSTKSILGM